jgi:hypothetical protein
MDAQRVIARRMVIGIPPDGLSPAWEKDFAQFPPAGVILFAARDFKDLADARRVIRAACASWHGRGGCSCRWTRRAAGCRSSPGTVVPPNAATLARAADAETSAGSRA